MNEQLSGARPRMEREPGIEGDQEAQATLVMDLALIYQQRHPSAPMLDGVEWARAELARLLDTSAADVPRPNPGEARAAIDEKPWRRAYSGHLAEEEMQGDALSDYHKARIRVD